MRSKGGGEGLRQFRTPTVPVVWSRITLSAVAADGDDLDIGRRWLPRDAQLCSVRLAWWPDLKIVVAGLD
jgi:hypothetical protein